MKKKDLISIVILIFFSVSISAFDVRIVEPAWGYDRPGWADNNPCWPMPVIIGQNPPQGFTVRFQITGANENDCYSWKVHLIQFGNYTYSSPNWSTDCNSKTITTYIPFQYFCFQNNAEVKVEVTFNGNTYTNNRYIRPYTEFDSYCPPGNGYKAAVWNRNPDLTQQTGVTLYHVNPCGFSGPQNAQATRKRVLLTVNGDFQNKTIIVNNDLSYGFKPASGMDQYRWAGIFSQSSSQVVFYTFVFLVTLENNQGTYWWPCSPDHAAVAYSVVSYPNPIMSEITQTPTMIYPNYFGDITDKFSQGDCCNLQCYWRDEYKPSFISYSYPYGDHGKTIYVHNNYSGQDWSNLNTLTNIYKVFCYGTNNYGTSDELDKVIRYSTNGGGCPWILVKNEDQSFEEDNNILHRSEMYPGEDITDRYKLRVTPGISIDGNEEINIMIFESDRKFSYFDQIKLYAVDHMIGTNIGVSENNNIVQYDKSYVVSTDSATFNNQEDITSRIQYSQTYGRLPVTGDTLDNIYTRFPNNAFSNVALITEMERDMITPNPVKDKIGDVITYTNQGTFSSPFPMREELSEVIVPITSSIFSPVSIYYSNINYWKHFKVKYISLAEISESGFDTYSIPLTSAILYDIGDITSVVIDLDQSYVGMDSLSTISLVFSTQLLPIVPDGYIRDYIFECTGRYVSESPYNLSENVSKPIFTNKTLGDNVLNIPKEYKLYYNYPNPFNPNTEIKYDLKKSGFVRLAVYNILGENVKELVNEYKVAGSYIITFDGANLASGVYFYKIETANFVDTKKMVLIK